MNRIFEVNECEGNYRRVLCVCSGGILRSATAAVVLSQHPYNCNTRAVGSEPYALIPVSQALVEWADEIVCMLQHHADRLNELFILHAQPIILGIKDDYDYRQPELVEMIKKRYGAARKEV